MILYSETFDQETLAKMSQHDPVVVFYRAFFNLIDWSSFTSCQSKPVTRGRPAHPEIAYIKALLVKIVEGKKHITDLRTFLTRHPLLVLELGFLPVLDPKETYGFNIQKTVPSDSWLRTKQRNLNRPLLQEIFFGTVRDLQKEIPGLGETVAFDVTHLYAWVKENNFRQYVKDRFCKECQPAGDPDCKVGVKRSTNQEQPDGSKKVIKEYLWGYGSGIVSAITADYGDVVLAEYTQPFREGDVTYYRSLYQQTVNTLNLFPTNITADAAFDTWYIYHTCALLGGIAAIPLNQHGHPIFKRDTDGVPFCPKNMRMSPTKQFNHTNGYRAQRYQCPLLFPQVTGQTCNHEQFAKGKGCVKDINIEKGGIMRVTLDRHHPIYKAIYDQRTSAERINSQAKALGIERPHVRRMRSVCNLNTLTYIIINVRALQRARSINRRILPMN
jgi:hypothetical protein